MALTSRQITYIEYLMANPMATNTEAGENLGFSRNTIAKWKDNPEVRAEIKRRIREKWEDSEAMAVEMMQKLAREGDFKANKYILDSLGYAPAQKIEADVNATNIVINLDEDG